MFIGASVSRHSSLQSLLECIMTDTPEKALKSVTYETPKSSRKLPTQRNRGWASIGIAARLLLATPTGVLNAALPFHLLKDAT
jgi:hypothetical protein